MAAYVHQLARATGWGYQECLEEVPLAVGLQIIDAELLSQNVMRHRVRDVEVEPDFDFAAKVERMFQQARNER